MFSITCVSASLITKRCTVISTTLRQHQQSLQPINYYKGAAQYNAGLFDDAATTYSALIKYDEDNFKPYFLRGSIYAKEGEIGQAITDYDAAVAIDEKNYLLYIQIYENLNGLGYTDQGMVYLNNALDIKDRSAESKYYKGRIYYILGKTSDAEKLLKKAIDKDIVNKIAETDTDYSDRPTEDQVMKKVTVETFGVEYPEPEKY